MTTTLKIKFCKKEETPPAVPQRIKNRIKNFSQIRPFSHSGAKTRDQAHEKENFKKLKKGTPGVHPRKKCAKFQPNRIIFEV